MFDMNFIRRVANALRATAEEGEQYAHLAAHADHLERDAQTNLNRAGRTAMRLTRAWNLDATLHEEKYEGPTKRLIIVRGKGTPNEKRIETNITLYWSQALQRYVTIPE